MKYGDSLSRAFKAMKSGALWCYAVTAVLAWLVPFAATAAVLNFSIGADRLARVVGLGSVGSGPDMSGFALMYVSLVIGGLIWLPVFYVTHGGFVHASDEVISGGRASVGDSWGFGLRKLLRTLGTDLLTALVLFGIMLVTIFPVLAIMFGAIAYGANRDNPGIAIVGFCCGYLLYFVALIAFALFAQAFEGISIRYALIGGRTSGDAVTSAWTAIMARKKNVLVFALIVLGLGYAYQLVTSVVTAPLYFVLLPWGSLTSSTPDPAAVSQMFNRMFLILYPVLIVLLMPYYVFTYAAWTAFFRQLTGLDAAIPPPVTPYLAPPYVPQAPAWPEPASTSETGSAAGYPHTEPVAPDASVSQPDGQLPEHLEPHSPSQPAPGEQSPPNG